MADPDDAATEGLERKLSTILSADVAAYSRLMAEDEEHTLQTFRGHREVFEKLVSLHRGRVFNTAGDAILAEFGSAVEAVRCATEIQAALRTRNDQLPEGRRVEFRIGVNLGDVMVQGQDLLGDGVNVAARLQSAAEPGGVCISGGVYDQIRNKLSLSFKPLGERNYKNIPQPVRTFAIAEAEGIGALPSPVERTGERRGGFSIRAAAAALAALLIAGGGFWAWSDHQRQVAEAANEARLTAEKAAADRALQQAEAERRAADAEKQKADLAAEKLEAEAAQQNAEAERQKADAARQAALAPDPVRAPPAAAGPGEAAGVDGLYGGQIRYGPGEREAARCFKAQAILQKGRISGEWPGRSPGATMHLAGDVSRSGDVVIHMHGDRADGSHFAVMDLAGTLRDGRIAAKGGFRSGRSVTLDWRKN